MPSSGGLTPITCKLRIDRPHDSHHARQRGGDAANVSAKEECKYVGTTTGAVMTSIGIHVWLYYNKWPDPHGYSDAGHSRPNIGYGVTWSKNNAPSTGPCRTGYYIGTAISHLVPPPGYRPAAGSDYASVGPVRVTCRNG